MPETRFLPHKTLRSTGLARTTISHSQPTTAGSNSTSPVSAAPGVPRSTHDHVVNARNPGAAASAGAGAAAARRPQDAKVQFVDRRPAGRPIATGGSPSFQTSVQLLDRPPAGGDGAGWAESRAPEAPATAGSPFLLEEALLIASLVEKYRDNTAAVGDTSTARTCQGILDKLRQMHSPSARATQITAASTASRPSVVVVPAAPPTAQTSPVEVISTAEMAAIVDRVRTAAAEESPAAGGSPEV